MYFFVYNGHECLQGLKQSAVCTFFHSLEGVEIGDLNVNCLLYADKAVLISSSDCELQASVTTLKKGCENNGLSLNNETKTKVQNLFESNEERKECKISVNVKKLEQVNKVDSETWYYRRMKES